jgi:hypothetical protein
MILQVNRLIEEADLAATIAKNAKETVADFDWEVVKKQWIELLQ